MRFNDKALVELSSNIPEKEGRLHHKKLSGGNFTSSGFKERWCKVISNILFFFHLSETGNIDEEKPIGALILENSIVQYEMDSETPFAFSVTFKDELDKKHIFSGRSEEYINDWVCVMKCANYEYWRATLLQLQFKICSLTGEDPLLLFPRSNSAPPLQVKKQLETHKPKKVREKPCSIFYNDVPSKETSLKFEEPHVVRNINSNTGESTNESSSSKGFTKIVGNLLEFDDNHFGNSLEKLGSFSWKKAEEETILKLPPPPPPVRPPRSPKGDKNRKENVPTGNLIDL